MAEERYVISVGAGKNQVPLIKRLAERGYYVVSFDKNINSPGKQFSYIFNNVSTWDYQNAMNWLDSLNLNFRGVLCFSYGKALVTQKKLINHFNLNCKIRENLLEVVADKRFLRKTLKELYLSTLTEYEDYEDYKGDAGNQDKLFIIKSNMGGSSTDVSLLKKGQECIKGSKSNYVIQEFIDGVEFRIVCLIKDRKIKFVSLMERNSFRNTFFTGRLTPKNNEEVMISIIEKIIEGFNIVNDALKIDLIKTSSRIEILEIDFGIGGDYFETIIAPLCYNYNYIDNYINLMLGLTVEEQLFLNNELCFDYIYNCGQKCLVVDYNKIYLTADKYFEDYKICEVQNQKQTVPCPKSNMDALFGILHNKKDMSNYDVNLLFNQELSNVNQSKVVG